MCLDAMAKAGVEGGNCSTYPICFLFIYLFLFYFMLLRTYIKFHWKKVNKIFLLRGFKSYIRKNEDRKKGKNKAKVLIQEKNYKIIFTF